jgi:quercetin dioxygenase-like cupin family protein
VRAGRTARLYSRLSDVSRSVLARWDELPLEKVTEMVARKVVAGAGLVLTQAYFKRGAIVPRHARPAETAVYVLQGAVRLHVDGEALTVREGEVLIVPRGASRQAEALDDTFLMTVMAQPE